MRRALTLTLLAFAVAPVATADAATAKIRKGPAGAAFYTPPKGSLKGAHGGLIWARKLTGAPTLKGASLNELVLYRSTSIAGKSVAVSGSIALPKGKAPKAGWPVITFAHGTTGIADRCAPTRDTGAEPLHGYNSYAFPLFQSWLKKGYAVVRTDYEGLGTPGPHPYLIGKSEGRSVLDMVRAAEGYTKLNAKKVIIAGHSQGGHAALWAGALAKSWTPELGVRGTVAFAPASQIETQAAVIGSLGDSYKGLTGLAATILRGVDIAAPGVHVSKLLSARAKALYPQTLTRCLVDLGKSTSFGGLAPNQLLAPGASTKGVLKAIHDFVDPQRLSISGPVLVLQGLGDTTVMPGFTDQTVKSLKARGDKITYDTFTGLSHTAVVTDAKPDAAAAKFIAAKLK